MMLADLGSDVLRVESPTRPDLLTQITPPDRHGRSPIHSYLNRSKRSLCLDLKKPGATDIVKRLIMVYDIVLEQFRPGVMKQLGLGYDALSAVNPRLIYCSLTGYGQTGPYRTRAGHDVNYMAVSGLASYSGSRQSGPPLLGVPMADVAGGSLHAVIGVLAAVVHRNQTGMGQAIDISMTDATFSLNAVDGPGYLTSGAEPQTEASLLNGGSFYGYYVTQDGRYLSVGSLEPKFRAELCNGIGRPDLKALSQSADPEDQQRFSQTLREVLKTKTLAQWVAVFAEVDACVEPVLTLPEAVEHAQIAARELVIEVPDEAYGPQRQLACPIKFSRSKPVYKHVGRAAGVDSQSVLTELGFTDAEIQTFESAGVFGPTPS